MFTKFLSWQFWLDSLWLAFLVVVFLRFWSDRKALLLCKQWSTTTGQITQFELAFLGHSIYPKIAYVYQVGDKDYQGTQVFLTRSHQNPHGQHARQLAYQLTKSYQENKPIQVYYNPQHPAEAVLDISISRRLNYILIFIVGLGFLHLFMMYFRSRF